MAKSESPSAEGRLAENILYFARALRAAGIPVGPGSVLDALTAVEVAKVGSRDDFYWTLHAVFVKRHERSSRQKAADIDSSTRATLASPSCTAVVS